MTIQINMPHDSSTRYGSTGSLDDRKDMQIVNDGERFKQARFWFWPIVFGVTLFLGSLMELRVHLLVFYTG